MSDGRVDVLGVVLSAGRGVLGQSAVFGGALVAARVVRAVERVLIARTQAAASVAVAHLHYARSRSGGDPGDVDWEEGEDDRPERWAGQAAAQIR